MPPGGAPGAGGRGPGLCSREMAPPGPGRWLWGVHSPWAGEAATAGQRADGATDSWTDLVQEGYQTQQRSRRQTPEGEPGSGAAAASGTYTQLATRRQARGLEPRPLGPLPSPRAAGAARRAELGAARRVCSRN